MNPQAIKQYLQNLEGERNGARLYQVLSEVEKDKRLAEVYQRMAEAEVRHAEKWISQLEAEGVKPPEYHPDWRTRTMEWLARHVGPSVVLQGIQANERDGANGYARQEGAKGMAAEEKSHAFLLDQITKTVHGGMEGGALAQLEGRHRASGGNALRAAVLGANDGLVSNLSLVMGVAGATMNNHSILISGIAGLLAGACSMALGEWISVQSSRELYENQIKIEAEEIENSPEEEVEELALIYEARGLSRDQSKTLAGQIMSNQEHALDTLAREELGLNPDELGGSAWEAAITSFILFTLGAIIPVAPFIFLSGPIAIVISILLATVGLFIIGAAITLFTGKPVLYSGVRMVIIGLAAAGVTFAVGSLIGGSIGG